MSIKRLQQLNALLLAHRQMLDWFVWINCELELFRELPDLRRGALKIQRQICPGLRAEHDVLGDSHGLNQHEVLMDHANAERDRIVRRLDLTHVAVNKNLTAVGGVKSIGDTHRRRLPRPILTNNGVNRPRLHDNVDMIVRQYIAESFSYLSEFEHLMLVLGLWS